MIQFKIATVSTAAAAAATAETDQFDFKCRFCARIQLSLRLLSVSNNKHIKAI